MKKVQIIDNDCFYDDKKYPWVKNNYPIIYQEVSYHDSYSTSSWYDISDEAFTEYQAYFEDMKMRGIFKSDATVTVI
jgi:hypothetical protein